MTHLPRWAQALDISKDKFDAWTASALPGQPALAFALERGLIETDAYFAWAREEYGLASLDTGFFFSGIDTELVRSARDAESYNAWFYPVGRWDDVTYVACVEPIDGLPESFCLVLADARAMLEAWTAAGAPVVDAYAPGTEAEAPAEIDTPAGFHANAKGFSLNLDNISLNLDESVVSAPDLAPPEPEMQTASYAPHEDTMLGKSIMFSTDLSVVMPKPTPIEVAPVAPSIPAPPSLAIVPDEAAPIPPQATAPGVVARPAFESNALVGVFRQLNQNYQNACVLRCTEAAMIRLYSASAHMKVVGPGPELDLGYPSFLRIVARTKQPYHGHLIDSPIHREFFQALGVDELPGCASAVPLMVDDKLWGVLVVTSSVDRRDAADLEPVRAAALQLTEALAETWRQVAA